MATNYFRFDGWVKSAQGPAVPGAQIYVCTQPANATALPPTPLANIFSDVNGLVPITQPILTDGFGHFDFYAAAAVYTIVVGLGGIVQQVYPDQSIGGASGTTGGGGGTALSLQTNGVSNSNQLVLNLKSSDGSVVLTSNSDGSVNVQAQSTKFNIANGAFFAGAGYRDVATILQTAAAGFVAENANQVVVFQFALDSTWTLSSASYQFSGGGSPLEQAFFGFYDANKNLLLSVTFDADITTLQTIAVDITLQAGITYYFAQSDTIGGGAHGPTTGGGNNDVTQMLSILGAGAPSIAIAANAVTAGSLPATLGTLTEIDVGDYTGMAFCIWKT